MTASPTPPLPTADRLAAALNLALAWHDQPTHGNEEERAQELAGCREVLRQWTAADQPAPEPAARTAEDRHRVALARELTAAAGVPLRDRYGYAAFEDTVHAVVGICFAQPDDARAVDEIGAANLLGDIHLAMGYDQPTDEGYEQQIVTALRPLVEQRRTAAARALEGR